MHTCIWIHFIPHFKVSFNNQNQRLWNSEQTCFKKYRSLFVYFNNINIERKSFKTLFANEIKLDFFQLIKWSETKTSFSLEDSWIFTIIGRNMIIIYKVILTKWIKNFNNIL